MSIAYAVIAIAVGLPAAVLFGQAGWAEALIGCSVTGSAAAGLVAAASVWVAVPRSRPIPSVFRKEGSRPRPTI